MLVYRKGSFIVFKARGGFVAYNTSGEFSKHHTHLRNFKAARTAIHLVLQKRIPTRCSFYYLSSLIRLSMDKEYCNRVQQLIDTRRNKGTIGYYNKPKNLKKK